MPKISIIIPVYNGEEYLEKCLESIKSQELKDIQAIIVNDGSVDKSEEIIDKYVEENPQIFEKVNKENGGQATARNLGITKARGEYIIFIDSDDYIEQEMLKIMYDKAQEDKSDIVVCDYYEVTNDKKIVKKAIRSFSEDMNINYILSNASPWNKLIKTELITKNNIKFLENHIYEDLATMPILGGYAKKITYLQKPLYNYIIREGSTMRQQTYNKKLESIFIAIEHLEKQMQKRNIYDEYKEELEYLIIEHLLYASSGRFLQYKEGNAKLKEIKKIIKEKYPNWRKNKYYKKQSYKFKLTCNIFYSQNKFVIKTYNKIRSNLRGAK